MLQRLGAFDSCNRLIPSRGGSDDRGRYPMVTSAQRQSPSGGSEEGHCVLPPMLDLAPLAPVWSGDDIALLHLATAFRLTRFNYFGLLDEVPPSR